MSIEYDPNIEQENTQRETDVKCPNCGATVQFDPNTGHMLCEYCGYERVIPPAEDGRSVDECDFNAAEQTASKEWGTKKKAVICKSCGAESVYDALQISDVCPYCGATNVTEEKDDDSLAPNGVAPFEITRETAGANFSKWLKGGLFTPTPAKRSCQADAFNGIYIPHWTYDTQTCSRWTGRAGYDETYEDKDGNTRTKTRWRNVRGIHNEFFDDELVNASARHDSAILGAIQPFDHEKLVPYKPEYVAGFVSERYSIGLKDGWEIARSRIEGKIRDHIADDIMKHYSADRADVSKVSTVFDKITFKYVLLPVWMSSFKYKDKVYQFMVNGQTGAVGGKRPVSVWRVLIAIAIVVGIAAALFFLFGAE